ncbi:hypothetical protein B0E38_04203 [Streptomyces sp. 111WW2]|nr:hypothetical protein B0E38_04203 [Streptomyces sp. 111WW2]
MDEAPRAKDDLRAKARELSLQGWTYDQIEPELGWAGLLQEFGADVGA